MPKFIIIGIVFVIGGFFIGYCAGNVVNGAPAVERKMVVASIICDEIRKNSATIINTIKSSVT